MSFLLVLRKIPGKKKPHSQGVRGDDHWRLALVTRSDAGLILYPFTDKAIKWQVKRML